jgi:Flp pilus assembly protein TadD
MLHMGMVSSLPMNAEVQNCSRHRRLSATNTFRLACLAALCCLFGTAKASVAKESQDGTSQVADKPYSTLTDARALLADGHMQKAEEAVRDYLAQNQSSGDAHFLLGLILFREIQAEALDQLTSSNTSRFRISPADAKLREVNARASLAEYTEGAKYEKPSATDLKIVALDYVLLGSYADASKWLTVSVQADPRDAEAWYYLGRARYNENRFEEAIQAFLRCLELKPRYVKAQSNLGLSYAGLNRIPEAQASFLKAIEWQSDSPGKDAEPYIDLGDLLIQINRAEEAVSYLTQAVTIAPRESRAREKLGSAYLNLNDLHAAQTQLEAGVALDPQNASLHYLLGSVYRKQGNQEKARSELERFQLLKEASGSELP